LYFLIFLTGSQHIQFDAHAQ